MCGETTNWLTSTKQSTHNSSKKCKGENECETELPVSKFLGGEETKERRQTHKTISKNEVFFAQSKTTETKKDAQTGLSRGRLIRLQSQRI
jgi:hypothetical protein